MNAELSLRAGDRERDETTTRLAQALSLGYLTQEEFDERSTAALRAVTLAELASLQADLPATTTRPARQPQDRRRRNARVGLLAHAGGYGLSVVIMLAIWVITAIAYGPYYFWPIWPILGGAMGLLGHAAPLKHAVTHGVEHGHCGRPALLRH